MNAITARNPQTARDLTNSASVATSIGARSRPLEAVPAATESSKGTAESATVLDLSDHAKSVIAKAKSDQAVAARVAAFAAAARAGSNGAVGRLGGAPITDLNIDLPPSDLTGLSRQGNFTSGSGTIWATNTVSTGPGSAHVAFVPTVEPMVDFSSRLQAGGFSIRATGSADDGTYAVTIDGPDGLGWSNSKSTPGAGLADQIGATVPPGGYIESEPGPGNTLTVRFYENNASGASATASSGDASLSVTSASARELQATVSIDFSTGAIQLQSSSASATSLSTRLRLSV